MDRCPQCDSEETVVLGANTRGYIVACNHCGAMFQLNDSLEVVT